MNIHSLQIKRQTRTKPSKKSPKTTLKQNTKNKKLQPIKPRQNFDFHPKTTKNKHKISKKNLTTSRKTTLIPPKVHT
jgi:hypothetical protein